MASGQQNPQAKKANADARKRGTYNFGNSAATPISAGTAKTQAKKATASAKKVATKAASTAKNNIDLGLASIARTTSTASAATRQTANTVNDTVERNAKVMKGAFANAAANVKQIQNKMTNYSKEVTTNLTQTANRAAQNANTTFELSRQNAEAISNSCQSASQAVRQATTEFFAFANAAFAENVETARAALECRNISELFQLQSNAFRNSIESAFEQSIRLSEIAIQTATEALEPINESVARSSKKMAELVS